MYSKEQLEKYPFFREKLEETDLSGMLDQLKDTDIVGFFFGGCDSAQSQHKGKGKNQGNHFFFFCYTSLTDRFNLL